MFRHSALICSLAVASSVHAQSGITCNAQMAPSVLAFGNVNPNAGATRLLGSVVVDCSNNRNTPPNQIGIRVALSAGQSGTIAQRRMNSALSPVPLLYNLYQDAGYSQIWSDSLGGPALTLSVPPGRSGRLTLPVFGRIPGSQTGVRPALYADALVLTVRY